jgi:hypothetical protein
MKVKNSKKVNEVFETSDYEMFVFRGDNRMIIPSHVKELTKDMVKRGWERGSYVVVNELMEIVDGQHRVLAAKAAGIPFHFISENGTGFDSIRGLNKKQRNWNIIDHIHGYISGDNKNSNYVVLHSFMNNFPTLRPTECMMIVKNSMSATTRQEFEDGLFVVRDMKLAYEWGHRLVSLKPYFENGYNKSIFVRAMIKVWTSGVTFDFDEFLHKIKLRPRMIYMCGTVDQYIDMIQEIYNYRRKGEEKIYFRF